MVGNSFFKTVPERAVRIHYKDLEALKEIRIFALICGYSFNWREPYLNVNGMLDYELCLGMDSLHACNIQMMIFTGEYWKTIPDIVNRYVVETEDLRLGILGGAIYLDDLPKWDFKTEYKRFKIRRKGDKCGMVC